MAKSSLHAVRWWGDFNDTHTVNEFENNSGAPSETHVPCVRVVGAFISIPLERFCMLDFNILEQLFQKAIYTFFQKEQKLLLIDANERSISHKLAEHLLRAMPEHRYGFQIDCEYNRHDLDPKRLDLNPPLLVDYPNHVSTWDDKGTTVYPDIIVHQRRLQENLLVIEIKKSTNNDNRERDLKKLKEFVRHPDYEYEFALFLDIRTGHHIEKDLCARAIWFHCEGNVAVEKLKTVYTVPRK
ncbi:hypothetical protein GC197_09870 [bacterium]|nr:hypothetical protein [bacterium]